MLAVFVVLSVAASSAPAGTIFSVSGQLSRDGAQFTGTIDIDTVLGKIDAVDIHASPIIAQWFGYAFADNTVHVAKSGGVPYQQYSSSAQVVLSASEGPILGGLFLAIPASTLIGYDGGPLVPTASTMLFQSGLNLRSAYDHYESTYWPMTSGSLTPLPLVVPEPSTLVLSSLALVALAAVARRRRLRRHAFAIRRP
jgi:PEP-CTERM motif-containing protein